MWSKEKAASGSGYNWYSIMTDTGEGLQFARYNVAAITSGMLFLYIDAELSELYYFPYTSNPLYVFGILYMTSFKNSGIMSLYIWLIMFE